MLAATKLPLRLPRGAATFATASSAPLQTLQHSWQGTRVDGGDSLHYIGGEWTKGSSDKFIDVHDPSTQRVLTRVPEATQAEMKRIVDKSEEAFDQWKDSSVLKRQAVMLK